MTNSCAKIQIFGTFLPHKNNQVGVKNDEFLDKKLNFEIVCQAHFLPQNAHKYSRKLCIIFGISHSV